MKRTIIVVFIALSLSSWAQTATQTAPSTKPDQNQTEQAKPACPCCDKAMSGSTKDMAACCQDMASKHKKDASSCCGGKDANCCMKDGASCKRNEKDKNASATCKDCCKGEHMKGCGEAKGDKTAMKCCGDHCERHAASAGM